MREDLLFANGCPTDDSAPATALYVDGGAAPSVVTLDHVTIAGHNCPFAAPTGAAILVEAGSKLTVKNSIIWDNSREFQASRQGHVHGRELDHDRVRQGQQEGRPAVRRSGQGRLQAQVRQPRDRSGREQHQRRRLPEVTWRLRAARSDFRAPVDQSAQSTSSGWNASRAARERSESSPKASVCVTSCETLPGKTPTKNAAVVQPSAVRCRGNATSADPRAISTTPEATTTVSAGERRPGRHLRLELLPRPRQMADAGEREQPAEGEAGDRLRPCDGSARARCCEVGHGSNVPRAATFGTRARACAARAVTAPGATARRSYPRGDCALRAARRARPRP